MWPPRLKALSRDLCRSASLFPRRNPVQFAPAQAPDDSYAERACRRGGIRGYRRAAGELGCCHRQRPLRKTSVVRWGPAAFTERECGPDCRRHQLCVSVRARPRPLLPATRAGDGTSPRDDETTSSIPCWTDAEFRRRYLGARRDRFSMTLAARASRPIGREDRSGRTGGSISRSITNAHGAASPRPCAKRAIGSYRTGPRRVPAASRRQRPVAARPPPAGRAFQPNA